VKKDCQSPALMAGAPAAQPSVKHSVNTAHVSLPYYRDALWRVLRELGWENDGGRPSSANSVVWWDEPVRRPHLLMLPPAAQVNRFYAMVRICRKVCLARLLDVFERLYPDEFRGLAPRTWWVGRPYPNQLARHRKDCQDREQDSGGVSYIVKPDNGCQGSGISIVRSHVELAELLGAEGAPPRAVVQEYLARPLLLDGLKFDLRLYVIVTCASPVQAFLSTRGVARFATHPWKPVDASNQHDPLMHLSNSSINVEASGVTNKVPIEQLLPRLAAAGADTAQLWHQIKRLVALTIAAMAPTMAHAYSNVYGADTDRRTACEGARRRCFQVLGFDVMLDSDYRPWLIETNHSPSMAIKGADVAEVEAKCSVIRAALLLATAAADHDALCDDCQVEALQPMARPFVELVERARTVFETHAASRSRQSWTMSYGVFERLLGSATGDASALRKVFKTAAAATADFGTGWDPPPEGHLTLFGFIEALLLLAPRQQQAVAPAVDQLLGRIPTLS